MKEIILKIPVSKNATEWILFINENLEKVKKSNCNKLVIDFSDVKFIDTNHFVVLACLIESFYLKEFEVSFRGGSERINNHLNNIRFKDYWKPDFDRTDYKSPSNNTTLCLWKITNDRIDPYSQYARAYFEQIETNLDLHPLSSSFPEVFNNIFDHSKSEVSGYIITQYYPSTKKISFSVCDFGVGIPTLIKEKLEGYKNAKDWEIIKNSLIAGVTTKSTPRNRGFGLNNILELIEDSNGSLLIISNKGYLYKKVGSQDRFHDLEHNFPGTLIKVEVDLNTFEEKNDNQEIFDL